MNMSLTNTGKSGLREDRFSGGVEIFSATMHTISEPDTLIEFAIDNVLALVGANAGSFFVWDEFQKELVPRSVRGGYRSRKANSHVKLREGILGRVAERGEPMWVRDVQSDERFTQVERNGTYQSQSFLCIPLIAQNKLVGVINVTERENLQAFTEDDFEVVKKFCEHIAIAYENLRLIQRLQNENDQLHQRTALLKQAMKEQETLVSIGKLAANLTHELNNPLDAIRRYVNLALDQALEDSLTREYLVKAKKGIRRAIRVIRGLLHYSRDMHENEARTAELHALISESLDSISQQPSHKKISIQKNFTPETIYVADRGLQMVFKNLYENAIQAMNGEGVLKVKTERAQDKVTISVEDSGCGVSEADAARIFEPFFTTKDVGKGTGIGLTLCREIVERCGGSISCSSSKEGSSQGATFIIVLPCSGR